MHCLIKKMRTPGSPIVRFTTIFSLIYLSGLPLGIPQVLELWNAPCQNVDCYGCYMKSTELFTMNLEIRILQSIQIVSTGLTLLLQVTVAKHWSCTASGGVSAESWNNALSMVRCSCLKITVCSLICQIYSILPKHPNNKGYRPPFVYHVQRLVDLT